MNRENKHELGNGYEELAASFLKKNGLQILEKNFRCRLGEIDLIARDQGCLVFVEVKFRRYAKAGNALEAVDYRKQRKISRVSGYYLLTHVHRTDIPCRFDVVGIDGHQIHWIKNAFDYCD